MFRFKMIRVAALLALIASPVFAQDASLGALPRVLDDRLKLELFAEHPTLVTPTGIDVDHLGRVWVLESNTHFPPDGYAGHPSDRLLVFQDTDGDGKADKTTVFADGFKFAMSVVVQPIWLQSGELKVESSEKEKDKNSPDSQLFTLNSRLPVYVATRGEIVRLRDTNNDLVADERTRLVHLETAGNYPHNGLAGIAFDALGWMYFGFGENLGADYKIIGSDGVTLSGGGEGGNMYRCRPDGSKLEKWATGFWNPHASCFDAFGRLFTVDNDPDSRPPCRLLHIIPGGDYGYRFRNGRRGTHPFTAWNGEIPGTLPMVSGTGEAPSGILCYESDGFPADYLGTLLVGSWGDHRIDQFVLEPKGASFVSKPKPIVQGTDNFRPVGLALAPDGSLYFSDWVLRDYKLHRKGRVWRLSAVKSGRNQKPIAGLEENPVVEELFKETDDAMIAVRRLATRRIQSFSNEFINKEQPNAEESRFVQKYLEWETAKVFTERYRFEQMMAETAVSGLNEWATEDLDLEAQIPQMGASFAAYFQLHDPIHGAASIEDQKVFSLGWGQWSDRFKEGTVQFKDRSVWMQLARRESLLSKFFATPPDEDQGRTLERIAGYLNAPDPFVLSALLSSTLHESDIVFRYAERIWDIPDAQNLLDGLKVFIVLAARQRNIPPQTLLSRALDDPSPTVLRTAVQWVGEGKLTGFRSRVDSILNDKRLSPDLLMQCLATLSLLDGVPPAEFEKTPPVTQLMKIVADDKRPAALRATALTMVPASTAELSTKLLLEFAKSGDAGLKMQAVRTLQQSGRADGIPLLLEIAADENAETSLRLDAIAGLCATPHDQPLPANIEQFLLDALNNRLRFRAPITDASLCRLEAIRALRGRGTAGSKIGEALRAVRETESDDRELAEALDLAINGKSSSDSQLSTLNSQPAPDNGRRVFYHHQGPLCFKCHTVNGRGGNVGPDLSVIARTMNREKLLGSILEPSKEISPQFLTWTILTDDGKTHSGIIVTENGGGDIELGDAAGNITKIPRKNIEERTPSNVSVMPQGLHQRMTRTELGELLDYLETLK